MIEKKVTTAQFIEISYLDLDPKNPRLPEESVGNLDEIMQYFVDSYDLEEIALSMAENGYFHEEPLLAVPSEGPKKETEEADVASFGEAAREPRYTVIEGNRRLATLKLINGEVHLQIPASLQRATESARQSYHDLTRVPVRIYSNRDDLDNYLGFRHVSGILQWDAEAKARFVYNLHRRGRTFQDIAKTIGSRADAVQRQYAAWASLQQARQEGVDVDAFVKRFGIYYRALQNPKMRAYLDFTGWEFGAASTEAPLQGEGIDSLNALGGYLFGPRRVLTDSRQLDTLADVLSNQSAREILEHYS